MKEGLLETRDVHNAAQPGVSIQRTISPSRTSWNAGGAGGGSLIRRAIISPGPCRCSSTAVVQWRVEQAFQPGPIATLDRVERVADLGHLLRHG